MICRQSTWNSRRRIVGYSAASLVGQAAGQLLVGKIVGLGLHHLVGFAGFGPGFAGSGSLEWSRRHRCRRTLGTLGRRQVDIGHMLGSCKHFGHMSTLRLAGGGGRKGGRS